MIQVDTDLTQEPLARSTQASGQAPVARHELQPDPGRAQRLREHSVQGHQALTPIPDGPGLQSCKAEPAGDTGSLITLAAGQLA